MSDTLDRTLERVRQNNTARLEAQSTTAPSSAFAARLGGGQILAGDRVFDPLSGQHGVVEASTSAGPNNSTLVSVRLDRGDLVIRPPAQLVLRPTPPKVGA